MDLLARIENAVELVVRAGESASGPPGLAAAIRHAVFPGGARIRPQLCLAVAQACGDDDPELSDAAAVAIELLHCASLVHDDLPCFDNAAMRRGQLSVHRAYGERLAVLAGDALIVRAFQALATGASRTPQRLARLVQTIGDGVGTPFGIVAGQSWECEPRVVLSDYQRAKTGALFVAATTAGAEAAGADPGCWQPLGHWLGEAYQVADDIRDVVALPASLGKPVGQDSRHARPSSAHSLGLSGAIAHFDQLVASAVGSIPDCRGTTRLRAMVAMEAERLVPRSWSEGLRSPLKALPAQIAA